MLAAADAYARLKKFGDAARIAREVVAKNPDNTEAQFRLGSSLERDGDSAGAEAVFLKLLASRPNDAATQNYLGYMWADKGVQLEKAREMLEKAVGREPRNAAYLDSLGWVYFRLGRIESAEKNLREAFALRDAGAVKGRHVVVIDDVWTTGATMQAMARVLKLGKPASLSAIVVAVADPRGLERGHSKPSVG